MKYSAICTGLLFYYKFVKSLKSFDTYFLPPHFMICDNDVPFRVCGCEMECTKVWYEHEMRALGLVTMVQSLHLSRFRVLKRSSKKIQELLFMIYPLTTCFETSDHWLSSLRAPSFSVRCEIAPKALFPHSPNWIIWSALGRAEVTEGRGRWKGISTSSWASNLPQKPTWITALVMIGIISTTVIICIMLRVNSFNT